MRSKWMWAALVVLLLGTASVLPAFGAAPTPRALYKALVASPIPRAQLPTGFYATKPIGHPANSIGRRHHLVGLVEIILRATPASSSGEVGSMNYVVFTTHDAALRNFKSQFKGATVTHLRGFPQQPAVIISGTGVPYVSFVRGVVHGFAESRRRPRRANALALARVALRHLKAVEQRTAR